MPAWAAIITSTIGIISHHKHMGLLKTHAAPKLAVKHVTPAAKRG